ncbi:MAG: diguanylate cyclase [Gammaproteobacteria bacterium]|jgi:diguanylate cyclase (GGDEF)-like protein|nr:diguanylate cyclase [Gammaproteobacteria bacterium]
MTMQIKIGTRLTLATLLIIGLSFALFSPLLRGDEDELGLLLIFSLFTIVVSLVLVPLLLPWICTRDLHRIQDAINGIKCGHYDLTLPIGPEPADPGDEYELNRLKRDIHWMQRAIALREENAWQQSRRIAALNETLRIEAITDKLTGLYNARYFWDAIGECFTQHVQSGEPLTFVILDIDFFKRINDTYGHPGGDQVLAQFARKLRASTREQDLVARIGGEEFALILRHLPSPEIPACLKRLHRELREHHIQISPETRVQITVSIGYYVIERQHLASSSTLTTTAKEVVKRADDALYWVKNHGRNGVMAWHELDHDYREQRLKLEAGHAD